MSSQELLSIVYTSCVLVITYDTTSPSFEREMLVGTGLDTTHIKMAGLNSSLTTDPFVFSPYTSNEVITASSSRMKNKIKMFLN